MTFDDPGASMDCARKRAHTEKAGVGSERVNAVYDTKNKLKGLITRLHII
jgi:hypothetical protein